MEAVKAYTFYGLCIGELDFMDNIEEHIVKLHREGKSASRISKDLNLNYSRVRQLLKNLGEYRPRRGRILAMCENMTDNQIVHLRELYYYSDRKSIADYLGVRYNSVGHILNYFGINNTEEYTAKRIRISKRKRAINIFKNINSDSAYMLGFILGDGSISVRKGRYTPEINICSKDFHILESFSNLVGISKINKYSKKEDPDKYWYCLRYLDFETSDCLINDWGIRENKSNMGCSPKIPSGFEADFLRGLFDSDGCVTYGNHRTCLVISICGHPSYMKELFDSYEFLEFTYRIRKSDGLAFLELHHKVKIKRFYDYIYDNPLGLHLFRKKEKFDEFYNRGR